jgi:hypothetical protein
VQPDAEAACDDGLQVDPPPAHDAVRPRVRAGFHDPRQLGQLLLGEAWHGPRMRPVAQPGETLGVVAVDPVPQRLPVHPGMPRRRLARGAFQDKRQGEHAARRLGVAAARRLPPQIARVQLQTRQLHRHRPLLDPKSGSQP